MRIGGVEEVDYWSVDYKKYKEQIVGSIFSIALLPVIYSLLLLVLLSLWHTHLLAHVKVLVEKIRRKREQVTSHGG